MPLEVHSKDTRENFSKNYKCVLLNWSFTSIRERWSYYKEKLLNTVDYLIYISCVTVHPTIGQTNSP